MGALLLLPEPSYLLLGKACKGPWTTVPRGHSVESRQSQPWHCGQHDKEGKEAALATPSTWPCLWEKGHGASSNTGGVRRGQEQALGESQLI